MDRKWTAAQLAAMNTKNKTLLVSAAAGSGKTATLTQRIINSLTDEECPASLDDMLVVTFTRSAAEELKTRIFSALSQALAKDPTNRRLTEQLIKLGSARISTIDSFYLDVLRANFSQLGISASFRIVDSGEMDVLKKRIMENVVEHFYDTEESFPLFAECLTRTRSTDKLSDVFISLANQTDSIPEGISFFCRQAEELLRDAREDRDFFSTSFGRIVCDQIKDTVSHCYRIFNLACEYAEASAERAIALLPSYSYDRSFCLSLLDALQDPKEAYVRSKELLESFSPIRLKPLGKDHVTEEATQFKNMRSKLHEKIKDLRKKSFLMSPEEIRRALAETARYTSILSQVLLQYDQRLTEEKQRRNIMEFHDVHRYTLRILVHPDGTPTEIAKQYAKQFSHIYIDEYQDVNLVQDLIFRAISKPDNRFMVGDIKQSIYCFRGSEPKVFSGYRNAFPDISSAKDSNTASIFMSENFRCNAPIISFTNLVCSRLFSVCTDSIGYQPEDDLIFAKSTPPSYEPPSVEVSVLLTKKHEGLQESSNTEESPVDGLEQEAELVADRITRMLKEETLADGRRIQPGDIAVLFRSNISGKYVADALHKRGILTSRSGEENYFESAEVLMVLCLLNTVDNPHRDIFLTGTLRSPLYGFSLDDLIQIRSSSDASYSLYDALLRYGEGNDPLAERCRAFRDSLEGLRQSALSLPIDRFLRLLFESDVFVATGLFHPDGNGASGNLLHLYEYARSFESGSFKGLYNFIELVNSLIEDGKKIAGPSKGSAADRVNLMNIHQSKGLEFPVCILFRCAYQFNTSDQRKSLLFDYPTGVAMKIADSTGFAHVNTPMQKSIASAIDTKQKEEEMRLLYVAMTRAREKLIITASTAQTEEQLMEKARKRFDFCDRYSMLRCNSHLDWILLPFARENPSCARLTFLHECDRAAETTVTQTTAPPSVKMDPILYQGLKEKFQYQYPYAELKRVPAKLSVSRLSPDVLDLTDTSADLFPADKPSRIPDFFVTGQLSRATAAERGTATHLFLQFCDLQRIADRGIREELARLVQDRFLPQNIADLVYEKELDAFLGSDLFRILQSAKRIIREQRFNLLLSPDSFTEDPILREQLKTERLAVQGVIDLIVIDEQGKLLLVDYKTDRLTKEELMDENAAAKRLNQVHGLQLSYYAHAAAMLFDRPCDRLAIYSTHGARLFDVTPLPLILSKNISRLL